MIKKNVKKDTLRTAAIYCRVSTVDQGKADFSSLNAQEEVLRQHCKENGWKVYKVYVDTKSGKTLERPELTKLLEDAKEKKFDVVLATKLDRLSRSVKDFLELDEIFADHGIGIVIKTQHIDTTTPAGQMQRTIMMAFAQFEREMIAERTRESTEIRAEKGFWLGGNVPLGYDVVDKKLVVNEKEAELVRSIFTLYADKPSTRAIARELNSKGYRAKVRITRSGKKKGGKEFSYQVIHDILRNRIYSGQIKMNGEIFKGLHSAIVDDVLFSRVQKRLDLSTIDTFATFEESPLLLLGSTKCGYCGKNLTTYFASNGKDSTKHYYYKCTTNSKQGTHKCPSRLVPAKDLEDFTQGLMIHTAREQGFFDSITAQIKDNSDDEIIQLNEERQKLFGNLSYLERKVSTLQENLTDSVLGKESKKKLAATLEDLEDQIKHVKTSISDLDEKISDLQKCRFAKNALQQILKEFEIHFNDAPMDQKRDMLKTIIEEIKVLIKHGEKEGTCEFKIRGNGTIVKQWSDIKTKRGVYSTPRVVWLRG